MIGGAVWDFRQSIGSLAGGVADNICFKALQMVPRAHTYRDFLTNFLTVEASTYNRAYQNQILSAFSRHNIYPSQPPLSASISGPFSGTKGSTGTWNAIVSGGTGSYAYLWQKNAGTLGSGSSVSTDITYNFTLNLTVTSGYQLVTASRPVSVYYPGGGCEPNCAKANLVNVDESKLPDNFELSQNYPNPFNPSTTIRFGLPSPSNVSLRIYNIQGEEVRTLVCDYLSGGFYEVEWDGRDEAGSQVASGIYIYRIQAGNFVQSKKMTFIK